MILVTIAQAAELLDVDPAGPLDTARIELGGFVEPQFVYTDHQRYPETNGELGFSIAQARVQLAAELRQDRRFVVRTQIGLELMPEARLKDAWVEIGPGRALRLRGGQMTAPVSRSGMVPDGALLFGERAETATLTNQRELGAMLVSELGDDHLEVEAAVFNGEGENRTANVDARLMYAGRVVISPWGGPGTTTELLDPEKRPTLSIGGSAYANMMGEVGAREAHSGLGVEVFGHAGPLTAQVEARWTWIDIENVDLIDSTGRGFYAQVGCFLEPLPVVGRHLAFVGRVEQLDPYDPFAAHVPLTGPEDTAQKRSTLSAGLGIYAGRPLFNTVRDLRAIVYWNLRQELEGMPYDNDGLVVATHFGF